MESVQETNITLSKAGKNNSEQLNQNLQDVRQFRSREKLKNWYPYPEEVNMTDELKKRVEHDIGLAKAVMVEIGYSAETAQSRLPTVDQIHFYGNHSQMDRTHGETMNEGGRININFDEWYVSINNWRRIGSTLVHEIGHYPAKRVYGPGIEDQNQASLVSYGLDRKKRYVTIMGTQYFQGDRDDEYLNGVLREPMADLFGYYCTEKREGVTVYHAQPYYRETAFTISLLQKLTEIRRTKFFDEFSRMYKSFNDADFSYFVSLRNDFAKYYEQGGLTKDEAKKKATKFISDLNKIQSKGGKDEVQIGRSGNPGGIGAITTRHGGQLTQVAKDAGFFDQFESNMKAINEEGLVLKGSKTLMTRDVNR